MANLVRGVADPMAADLIVGDLVGLAAGSAIIGKVGIDQTAGQNVVVTSAPTDTTASGTITTQNLVPAGTATAGSAVAIALSGDGTVTIQVTGTYTGALSAQVTVDGTNWITLGSANTITRMSTGVPLATIASGVQDIFQVDISGFAQFRITGLAAMTGTATVSLRASNAVSGIYVIGSLPTGTNSIGTVDTELPAAAVPANGASYPTAPKVVAILMGDNGSTNDMLQLDAQKNLKSSLRSSANGSEPAITDFGNGDGISKSAYKQLAVGSFGLCFNNVTWDGLRNNHELTLLSSAARTSTTSSSDTVNYNARGMYVVFDVTAGSILLLTLTIDMKDSLSGKYVTLLTGASVVGTSTNIYKIYPGLVAATNIAVDDALPRTFRITVTHGNATSCTYSVGGSLIL